MRASAAAAAVAVGGVLLRNPSCARRLFHGRLGGLSMSKSNGGNRKSTSWPSSAGALLQRTPPAQPLLSTFTAAGADISTLTRGSVAGHSVTSRRRRRCYSGHTNGPMGSVGTGNPLLKFEEEVAQAMHDGTPVVGNKPPRLQSKHTCARTKTTAFFWAQLHAYVRKQKKQGLTN